jgi:ABC-type transporter lipoprotein component MlaA
MTALVNSAVSDSGDRDRLCWSLTGLNIINTRATIPFRYYETGSPFEYELMRYAYLKDRQINIEEGIPVKGRIIGLALL